MSEVMPNFEGLLREALAPIEPPADLVARLEGTLTSITEMAADELEAWELSAMRDPRNWAGRPPPSWPAVRPAPRWCCCGTRRRTKAAAGLNGVRDAAERAVRDLERETRKLLGER